MRRALRHEEAGSFTDDLAELRAYLDGSAAVTARPRLDRPPPVFVIATGSGLTTAGDAGLPVVLGGPALDDATITDRLTTTAPGPARPGRSRT